MGNRRRTSGSATRSLGAGVVVLLGITAIGCRLDDDCDPSSGQLAVANLDSDIGPIGG